jgi:hypothetical protein
MVYQQSILIWYDNFLNQTFAKFAVGWMPSLYSWKLYWFLAFFFTIFVASIISMLDKILDTILFEIHVEITWS